MNNTYFIADTHFSHQNILYFKPKRRELAGISFEELKNGDIKDVLQRHDEWLIDVWNSTIKKEDYVYILGDLSFAKGPQTEKILQKLKGTKFLILGNHDKSCKGLERYFEWVGDIKEAKFSNSNAPFIDPAETFCAEMCHYPLLTWNRRTHGSCMVHGHTHGAIDKFNNDSLELRVDVGFDGELADLKPVPLEKLYEHFRSIIAKQGFTSFKDYNEWLMGQQGFRM